MNQVVQTVRTFQTSAGPALEARVNDPALGDVRVVVTGRAGEVVQAQLIVRDRAAADTLAQAAARVGATSDALAGVSLTVRSESGGSTAGGHAGSGFEAAAWGAPGYGTDRGGGGSTGSSTSSGSNAPAGSNGFAGGSTSHAGHGGGPGTGGGPTGPQERPAPAAGRSPRPSLPVGLPGARDGSSSDRRSLDIRA
jgi:hypothetical protein